MEHGRFADYELARVVTDNLVPLGIQRGDLVTILEAAGDGYLVQSVNMNEDLAMPWGGAALSDLEPSDGLDEKGNSLIRPILGPP
ncbi:hypothetical protein CH289_18030 [Rhodococcus sp. RS1C4]|uniref:hypothetical protein n=1 Tax=Rhodococcoides fascians TaxID=1828 RepID=UPI0009B8008A|nr:MULTISPECIES: hypothetical protein [Rhodococcus]OZC49078.1 hypothetical protein CH289_18030 [Rhodococcus sp. RS1C4]